MSNARRTGAAAVESSQGEEARGRPALVVVEGGRSDAVPVPIFDDGWALAPDAAGDEKLDASGAPGSGASETFWRRLILWWRQSRGFRSL